jgi:NAD(P)H-dependent flavin oxidoreductase YrpB (nitropropane dioxygenase family)
VPEATKARYVQASTEDILVTRKVDGLPQRMIRNEALERIERAGNWRMLALALSSAIRLKRLTGASVPDLLSSARKLGHGAGLTWGQTLLAAIAPAMFQRSMVEGEPREGLLASGLIAGRLKDLPSCEELIQNIVREAHERIAALGAASLAA